MIMPRRRIALLLSLAFLCALSLSFVPRAHAQRGASLTTELDHGVACTTQVVIVSYGLTPSGFHTYHTITCTQAVGRLQVNAGQTNEEAGRYYPSTAVCYNTASCSTSIYILKNGYAQGEWLLTTSGHVGTAANQFYYGVANTVYLASTCIYPACEEGEIPD